MIESNKLGAVFRAALEHAGWTPNRSINIDYWVSQLSCEGFICNPYATSILESIGGLVVHLKASGLCVYDCVLEFDPVRAASGESDRTELWQAELGITLFPIGRNPSADIIWIGNNGHCYYGHGFGLYYVADSFYVAMDYFATPTRELALICSD